MPWIIEEEKFSDGSKVYNVLFIPGKEGHGRVRIPTIDQETAESLEKILTNNGYEPEVRT